MQVVGHAAHYAVNSGIRAFASQVTALIRMKVACPDSTTPALLCDFTEREQRVV